MHILLALTAGHCGVCLCSGLDRFHRLAFDNRRSGGSSEKRDFRSLLPRTLLCREGLTKQSPPRSAGSLAWPVLRRDCRFIPHLDSGLWF